MVYQLKLFPNFFVHNRWLPKWLSVRSLPYLFVLCLLQLFFLPNFEHSFAILLTFSVCFFLFSFVDQVLFRPFKLKELSFHFEEYVPELDQFIMNGFFLIFQILNVFLQLVVFFLGVLHYLFYELNASILVSYLRTKFKSVYLYYTVFSMFQYSSLYFLCSSVHF